MQFIVFHINLSNLAIIIIKLKDVKIIISPLCSNYKIELQITARGSQKWVWLEQIGIVKILLPWSDQHEECPLSNCMHAY